MKALADIRVLDLGTFIAGPFCATLLGEFGAEVIKIEPKAGDNLRRFGTDTEVGDTLAWMSESRNKQCATLNFRDERARAILKELVKKCDIVIENFRPGVAEKLGLSYEEIKEINPRAIFVRISAYGQTGPLSQKPGFARIAHAFSGLAILAGEPDRIPVTPGSTSLADYSSGLFAAFGALTALHARGTTGRGQCVDLALYESMFRMLDDMAPAFKRDGFVRQRMGAETAVVTPHSHYRTADDDWVAIACSSDKIFNRLAAAMNRPELADRAGYGNKAYRLKHRDALNRIVSDWTASLSTAALLRACDDADVPASKLLDVADIFENPQYRHRENIREVDSRAGKISIPNVIPKLSETPGAIEWSGPALGEHNKQIYMHLLGMTQTRFDGYVADGLI